MHVPKLFLTEPYSWKVKYIDLCPTWRCNARCITCGCWKRKDTDLGMDQTIQIVKHFRNLSKVVIEGGEPTLWNNLKYFIKCVDSEEKIVITNAINTNEIHEIAKYFSRHDMRWVVSLNGLGSVHDKSRGTIGAFNHLVKSVDIMKDLKYDVRFQFMPFQENLHDLEVTKQFIADRWGGSLSLCYPSTAGRFGENIKCTYLNPEECSELFKNQGAKRLNRIIEDIYTSNAITKEVMPCFYGRSKIHIVPDGGIKVCQFEDGDEMYIGRVNQNRVSIDKARRKYYCKNIIPNKCQFASGGLCNNEPVAYGIRHSFFYLMREAWKRLI